MEKEAIERVVKCNSKTRLSLTCYTNHFKHFDMGIIKFNEIKNHIKKYINLAKALKNDKRVPKISKILLATAIGYFFIPIDIIPDFIPVLGYLDDIIIIPSLIYLAIRLIPKEIFSEHYRRIFKK